MATLMEHWLNIVSLKITLCPKRLFKNELDVIAKVYSEGETETH